jgi:hypothetical protein
MVHGPVPPARGSLTTVLHYYRNIGKSIIQYEI